MINRDSLYNGVVEFIDEMFNNFAFNITNVANKIGVKVMLDKYFNTVADVFANEDGLVDVLALEKHVMPEINKLGKFEVKGFNNVYNFDEKDVVKLFNKLKEKSNEQ